MTTTDALNKCLEQAAKLGTPTLIQAWSAIPEQYHAALIQEIKRQHQAAALEVDYAIKGAGRS